jgi:excisionase family DNA binding protein
VSTPETGAEMRSSTGHTDGNADAAVARLAETLLGFVEAIVDERIEARLREAAGQLMTASQAAEYASANVETVRRAIRRGDLPTAGSVGRSPRVSRLALDAWMAEKRATPAPQRPRASRVRGRKGSAEIDAAWRDLEVTRGH